MAVDMDMAMAVDTDTEATGDTTTDKRNFINNAVCESFGMKINRVIFIKCK